MISRSAVTAELLMEPLSNYAFQTDVYSTQYLHTENSV
jgi:hypothetical protein